MNEFESHSPEIPPIPEFNTTIECFQELGKQDLLKEIAPFFTAPELLESRKASKEFVDEREFGLKECVESARDIFTLEVISEWGRMPLEKRNEIVQEYQHAIADSLGIERGNVYFEEMAEGVNGYNNGDGNVYLNIRMLADPKNIIGLIDVVAHETRHQFQHAVVENPERFGISREVANEWAFGMENYTVNGATQYDPWGYHYNPVEVDARYFGEAVVRELTKGFINDYASIATNGEIRYEKANISFGSFINDRDWHIKQAEKALEKGDMNGYKNHMTDAKRSTK
ncbi:MAG: hypothetical protein J6W09_06650 [Bacteroidales bacterium]|nr:hypothetical protein [Bacteroidales bacterium]